jgi:hypothetical protein
VGVGGWISIRGGGHWIPIVEGGVLLLLLLLSSVPFKTEEVLNLIQERGTCVLSLEGGRRFLLCEELRPFPWRRVERD